VACFAASLGPVVWVVLSEIFPIKGRGLLMSVATFVLWLANFVVSFTFPWLLANLGGGGTFLLYATMSVLAFLFVWRAVPETKGKSLEELEKELVGTTS
jgi:SP family sugar porter-like MFS transporter